MTLAPSGDAKENPSAVPIAMGVAPFEVPFTYYGTVRIDAWSGELDGVTQYVELAEPWYEHFPLDLIAELLDPFTHVDRQLVTVELNASAPAAERPSPLERAEALRRQTQ